MMSRDDYNESENELKLLKKTREQKELEIKKNLIELNSYLKFKDIEKYGDSLYKKIKEKAVNSESKIDTELSMQNEFDFQIYGNLGLNIDYDVDNLWDMKFDFRNNRWIICPSVF